MGQKVRPTGFRTGIMLDWQSTWYANKQDFAELLIEDFKIAVDANHPVVHYRNFCGHVVYFTSSPNVMLVSAPKRL